MRERPILFNGADVRALLAGQKTQARRVVKPQPPTPEDVRALAGIDYCWLPPSWPGANQHRVGGPVWAVRKLMGQEPEITCPFGQPGDRLWVREAFCDVWDQDRDRWSDPARYYYRADGVEIQDVDGDGPARWTPSIHMPRRACRLVLEITAVRVERLQAISTQDCLAEGITTRFKVADAADELRIQFRDLWNDAGGDWDSNPWVWVIEFRRCLA
ncbi:hypothetical protein ACPEH7_01955 [Stenotrophomonas sp. NPDC101269]|uniref:hypothetical protein n=1 Tax=Stenotrophomonas sp. NPDC101269 TaxID=3415003 RepID=UPI003C303E5F